MRIILWEHFGASRMVGNLEYSFDTTKANLHICEDFHWNSLVSQCHRILGDLDSKANRYTSAHEQYESALKITRSISVRNVLIEALVARGRFLAKAEMANDAFNDLNEVLGYCIESSYRIYEADVRVALGWAYLANGEKEKAKGSAERALQMSSEMGYHWGKVDAEEVLKAMSP
jgi:tetratricopeptide (TPR) repeat protein